MGDWIKLHRSILQSNVFDNPEILKVWIWILCKAEWAECKKIVGTRAVNVKPGQMIFTRSSASRDLEMSESKVYRIMQTLQSLGNINIKVNSKFSLVTVENWGFFQYDTPDSEQQMNSKRTASEQQLNSKRTASEQQVNSVLYNKNKQEYQEGQEIKENNTHTHAREGEEDDRFDDFWKAYPKKNGDIREAYLEYSRAVQSENPETLISAIKKQTEGMSREDFRYLPSAEKWLRNKGWLAKSDFKEPEKKKPQQEDGYIAPFTPKEKRHEPYDLSDMVEWPPGSNQYRPSREVPKDDSGY